MRSISWLKSETWNWQLVIFRQISSPKFLLNSPQVSTWSQVWKTIFMTQFLSKVNQNYVSQYSILNYHTSLFFENLIIFLLALFKSWSGHLIKSRIFRKINYIFRLQLNILQSNYFILWMQSRQELNLHF